MTNRVRPTKYREYRQAADASAARLAVDGSRLDAIVAADRLLHRRTALLWGSSFSSVRYPPDRTAGTQAESAWFELR